MYLQAFFIKERIHANDIRQPTMWLASLILGCMSPYLGMEDLITLENERLRNTKAKIRQLGIEKMVSAI
ncbi:MAG: hypothetical protein WA323_00505 [Candidatus Nitrosopolaris sp.]